MSGQLESNVVSAESGAATYAASGKVTAVREGKVVFAPTGTNYELELLAPGFMGPINKPLKGIVRVTARKLWTVPSGGNSITPIFGSPRIIQGRVRALDPKWLVVQAGTLVRVDLPAAETVYEMANGPITVGAMVNVTALPGATFEHLG